MNEVDAALEIYRDVLSRDPQNVEARTALERLLQLPKHSGAVSDILEPIYNIYHESFSCYLCRFEIGFCPTRAFHRAALCFMAFGPQERHS